MNTVTDWYSYEKKAAAEGVGPVCGIDEAGRGPLAGPVFAAAVVLPAGVEIPGVNDSKKLSAKQREALFDVIVSSAADYGIGFADEKEIDRLNILNATFLAMRRAVANLAKLVPQAALVDGNRDPGLGIPTLCIVGGDAQCASVAAASILAKVSRDRYMARLDEEYPQYDFARHKGYPTKLHYERLLQYGVSPVHRRSFLKNLEEKRAKYGRA